MQSFSAWARWVATTIWTGVVLPLAAYFIEQQPPSETTSVVLKLLLYLSEQTWFRVSAFLLTGFVAGLWVDWLLRKLDGSRADRREALGTEMLSLDDRLEDSLRDGRDTIVMDRPQIMSCLITASKLGIWVPDQRLFTIEHGRAYFLIRDYLMHVGRLLRDGHFREAKDYAANSETAFAAAYLEHDKAG
jgi:hypothetical protein